MNIRSDLFPESIKLFRRTSYNPCPVSYTHLAVYKRQVRSYVEDAPAESLWKAMDRREHPSQKKTAVLAKLKEHAQTAPYKGAKKPEQTKKPKSKEMEM